MVDHLFVFAGNTVKYFFGDCLIARHVHKTAVGISRHEGAEDLLTGVSAPADAVDGVDLVEVVGVRRVTAHVAPDCRHRHFARFFRHHAEGRAVAFFYQLKAVFLREGLHKLVIRAESAVARLLVAREEVREAADITFGVVPRLVFSEELFLRLEVQIYAF